MMTFLRTAAALAAIAVLGAAPAPVTPPRTAIVTCADGARLYLFGTRDVPLQTTDSEPTGAQVKILDGPRSVDNGAFPYYEINVPTLHRTGDGDYFWVSSVCLTFTN